MKHNNIKCSTLSGSELKDYINKVKKNAEIDLEDLGLDRKLLRWYMYDNMLVLYVYFDGPDNFATIRIDIDDFAADPFYISYDADLIVNRVKKYMRDNNIKLSDSEKDRYEYIRSKSVMDSDGFYTDYTMYYDTLKDRYVFIFGDNDLYTPENTEPDWEADSKETAEEWFDDYTGFEDEDDDWSYDDVESCESIRSDWNIEDQIDAPDTIGKLNVGDKFVNRNGVVVEIIEPDKFGRVQFKIGDDVRSGNEKSIQQMLYRNNYLRKVETSEFVDMGTGLKYWYFTTHGVQPGSVPKGLNIIKVVDRPNGSYFLTDRVITTDALKYYDIKEKSPDSVNSSVTVDDEEFMDATDVVLFMGDQWPTVEFIDESDTDSGEVELIFDASDEFDNINILKQSLDNRDLKYNVRGTKVYIYAPEDPSYMVDTDGVPDGKYYEPGSEDANSSEFAPYIHVTAKSWDEFLHKVEEETGLKVDSAYKRRHKGDDYLELIDEYLGDTFSATYTQYSDGSFEFRGENLKSL